MAKMQVRRRAVAAAALLLLFVAAGLGRPILERTLHERIEQEGRRLGVAVRLRAVQLGLWPPLSLQDIDVTRDAWSLRVERVALRPSFGSLLGTLRLEASGVSWTGRGGWAATLPSTAWDVAPLRWRAVLREPFKGLVVSRGAAGHAEGLELEAEE